MRLVRREISIFIPKDAHSSLFWAIRGMSPGLWVDRKQVKAAQTLGDLLAAWRWDPVYNTTGDIVDLRFFGTYLGDEYLLWPNIAAHGAQIEICIVNGTNSTIYRIPLDSFPVPQDLRHAAMTEIRDGRRYWPSGRSRPVRTSAPWWRRWIPGLMAK